MQTTNQTDLNQTNFLQQQIQHVNGSFFADEISINGNGICGICGICANAFAQSYHCNFKSSIHEALFHLQATHLCSQLIENQQKQLSSLMNDIITKRFDTTKVRDSIADIRKFYTTGKYSIYQNLPCQKTFEKDNHACVSISDILNHSLAMGIKIDLFRSSYHKQMAIDNKDLMCNLPWSKKSGPFNC